MQQVKNEATKGAISSMRLEDSDPGESRFDLILTVFGIEHAKQERQRRAMRRRQDRANHGKIFGKLGGI